MHRVEVWCVGWKEGYGSKTCVRVFDSEQDALTPEVWDLMSKQ